MTNEIHLENKIPQSDAPARERPRPMLSVNHRLALLDIIDELDAVARVDDLLRCVDGRLQGLLPHGGLVCGLTADLAKWQAHWMVNHRFPRPYLGMLRQANGGYDSEMIRRWLATGQPVCADPRAARDRWWSDRWMGDAVAAGLANLIGHGFVDLNGKAASYFCFIRVPEPPGERHAYVLKRLMPHLHGALARTRPQPQAARPEPSPALTRRQVEILEWLRQGKTNQEVAAILDTSENNVKYHLKTVFGKLGVTTRTQAVAQAMARKLLAEL